MDGLYDELQLLEPTKTREPDAFLRTQLLETLLLLATTRHGRQLMRRRKVYPIVRHMHLAETDEQCDETARRLVDMLMRDEQDDAKDIIETESTDSVCEAEVVEEQGTATRVDARDLRAVSAVLKQKIDEVERADWGEIQTGI